MLYLRRWGPVPRHLAPVRVQERGDAHPPFAVLMSLNNADLVPDGREGAPAVIQSSTAKVSLMQGSDVGYNQWSVYFTACPKSFSQVVKTRISEEKVTATA